jgi:hypothetical protein
VARDILRIVEPDQVTAVKDLNDGTTVYLVKDSLNFTPPQPAAGLRKGGRGRWEGYQQLSDIRDNGALSFSLIISWLTHPNVPTALDHANDFCAAISSTLLGRMIEFRHRNASESSFFDVRGAAGYQPNLRLNLLEQKSAMAFDFKIPVGPLVRNAPVTLAASASTAFPAKVALPTAIVGKAPALADLELDIPVGGAAPLFAAVGWSKRIGAGSPPFGIVEGEAANGSSFTGISGGDASMRGGSYLYQDLTAATYSLAYWYVEPWRMDPDEFSEDIDVEVYAVLRMPSTAYSLRCVLSSPPTEGAIYGQRFGDLGSRGRTIVPPYSSTQKRITRLGVVRMPCVPQHGRWLMLEFYWDGGSYDYLGVDYLVMIPAKRSVAGPTGKASDYATYPRFIPSNVATKRVLKHNGSGLVAVGGGAEMPYGGMGSRIELPPGDVDVTVLLASMVPDDPTINDTGLQLSHSGTLRARTFPRNYSLRGSS